MSGAGASSPAGRDAPVESVVSSASKLRAVVLLSGGLDSAVCLGVACSDGHECHALSFDYGQRHRAELASAARVARQLGAASHKVLPLDLRAIGGSALTADIAVPKHDAGQPLDAGIPITYVPARNLTFLALALGYAETLAARDLYLGVNAVDYSGYPDCRPAFIRSFEGTANLGTKLGVESQQPYFRVRTPLIDLAKRDIIALGAKLGVDFALTHSCYDPDAAGRACGHCDSCLIRARGFRDAGLPDPTRYAPDAARPGAGGAR